MSFLAGYETALIAISAGGFFGGGVGIYVHTVKSLIKQSQEKKEIFGFLEGRLPVEFDYLTINDRTKLRKMTGCYQLKRMCAYVTFKFAREDPPEISLDPQTLTTHKAVIEDDKKFSKLEWQFDNIDGKLREALCPGKELVCEYPMEKPIIFAKNDEKIIFENDESYKDYFRRKYNRHYDESVLNFITGTAFFGIGATLWTVRDALISSE